MIAQAAILALLAAAAWAVGVYGLRNPSSLIDLISDADLYDRRERSIRRGSIATLVVAVVLALGAVASVVAWILG